MELEEAIAQTFKMMGLSVLSQPKRLMSCVLDLCDGETRELRVFKNNCDEGLCSPFASVVNMPSPQMRDLVIAAQNAEMHLRDDRMISEDAARETSRCLARAVGHALGLPDAEIASLLGPEGPAQQPFDQPAQDTMVSPAATGPQQQNVASSPTPTATNTATVGNQYAPAPAQANAPAPKKSALPWVLVAAVAVIGVVVFVAVTQFGVLGNKQSSDSTSATGVQGSVKTQQEVGSSQVEVPSTAGLTLDSARVNIESAGLKVQVEEEESDATPQTVLRSDPSEGTQVQAGSTVTLVVAKEAPAPEPTTTQTPSTPAPSQTQTPTSSSSGYGPATFSSTGSMDDVWDLVPYFDHTPQTVHTWMLDNGFWVEGCGRDCVSYLSEYGTQFVYEQTPTSPESNEGYSTVGASVDTPLQNGMPWRVMRVHFWGEGLDYAINKCNLGGESWRGSAGDLPTLSSSYMLVGSDAPAAQGSSGGYQWEAAYDAGSSFCTVVVRVG